MNEELLPCPKCGGKNLVADHYSVGCVDCQEPGEENTNEEITAMGGYNSKCIEEAIRKWNKR